MDPEKERLTYASAEKNFLDIKQSAEIALEQQTSKAFKNDLVTVALENIVSLAKKGIDEIERVKKDQKSRQLKKPTRGRRT